MANTEHSRRATVRLGNHVRTSCTCGWVYEDRNAPSGDAADEQAWGAFDRHMMQVDAEAIRKELG